MYRTSVPGISAVGDVITLRQPAHPQLAHVSSAEGIVARRADRRAGDRARSTTTTCPAAPIAIPEIGSVGLTEARGEGARLRRADRHVSVRRARPRQDGRRDRRLREDRRRQEVRRGARRPHDRACARPSSSPRRRVALRLESTVEELIRTIHAHPTMAEAVGEAAHATHGAAIHAADGTLSCS